MKVGFFCQSESHLSMAALMLESVRQSMPGVEVHHLTDEKCHALAGVDSVRRLACSAHMPMAVRRMTHHSACDGDWLFVDSDVIVQKDVRGVFDAPFDIALTDRLGTITNEAKYAAVMPHNIGVVFSRSPAFWREVIERLQTFPPNFQEWEGDQRVINDMVRTGGHGFVIATLPGLLYNYPPRAENDERTAGASIVHYKGNRKQWLTSHKSLSVA